MVIFSFYRVVANILLKELYLNGLQEKLSSLVFHGEDGNQGIQFQTGYLVINSDNKDKYQDYADVASHLKRQIRDRCNCGILGGKHDFNRTIFLVLLWDSVSHLAFVLSYYLLLIMYFTIE